MDSVTQAALGAAIGEGLLGKKGGNRAPIWGAILGTLPDLDVFFNRFMTQVEQISFHRGPSHSILFALLVAPLAGAGLRRLHTTTGVSWRSWSLFAFLCIVTHPLLDALTNYGTQLFWPFTDYPVAWASIAIVDPLYTLPLLVGVIAAMIVRDPVRSARWNRIGLIVSTAYMGLTAINKVVVEGTFRSELERQNIPYQEMITYPTVFNNILWVGLAENDDTVWAGLHSHADGDRPLRFYRYPKRNDLISDRQDEPAVRKLLWFSQGFYHLESSDSGIIFHDLHVGERESFMWPDGHAIFSFRLAPSGRPFQAGERGEAVEPLEQEMKINGELLGAFWHRIWGREPEKPDSGSSSEHRTP